MFKISTIDIFNILVQTERERERESAGWTSYIGNEQFVRGFRKKSDSPIGVNIHQPD